MNTFCFHVVFLITLLAWFCQCSEKQKCAVSLQAVRILPDRNLVCGTLSWKLDLPSVETRIHLSSNRLDLILASSTDDDDDDSIITGVPVALSNTVCTEDLSFYIGKDLPDHQSRKTISLCAEIPSSGSGSTFLQRVVTKTIPVRVEVKMHGQVNQDCRVMHTKDASVIPVRTEKPMGSCPLVQGNCQVTCSSLAVGQGNEHGFHCREQQKNECAPDRKILDEVKVGIRRTVYEPGQNKLCVQMTPLFSEDVRYFRLDAKKTQLQLLFTYSNLTNIARLDHNTRCLSMPMPWHRVQRSDTNKKTLSLTLCTSFRVPVVDRAGGSFKIFGSLYYSVVSVSGRTYEKYIHLEEMLTDPVQVLQESHDACTVPSIRRACQTCRQTCSVMVEGEGYLSCKSEWFWYDKNKTVFKSSTSAVATPQNEELYYHGLSFNRAKSLKSHFLTLMATFIPFFLMRVFSRT